MKEILISILILFICINLNAQRLYLWNTIDIQNIKKTKNSRDLGKQIIEKADVYLQNGPVSLTNRNKSFAPNPHYFESVGPYWWPDQSNPKGAWINKDGHVNPQSKNYDNNTFEKMSSSLCYLSIAYYLTLDNRYYDAAINQLKTWFIDKETYMYPNLEYGMVIPGKNNNRGRSTGLIGMYDVLNRTIESVRLLNETQKLDVNVYLSLQKWMKDFLLWCNTSNIGKEANKGGTNIALAYQVLKLNIAIFVNDNRAIHDLTNIFRRDYLEVQIAHDGSMPEELKRTKSYSYSIYNLTHIVDFCVIQENLGCHYYELNKEIIDRAFLFLLGYVERKNEWPYKQFESWDYCVNCLKQQVQRLKMLHPRNNKTYNFEDYTVEGSSIF